jgi:hypothetical protein
VPERIVLPMLLLQHSPTERVAWSTKLPEVQVLGWAALGLLRLLPLARFLLQPGEGQSSEPQYLPPAKRWRVPIGDPGGLEIGEGAKARGLKISPKTGSPPTS